MDYDFRAPYGLFFINLSKMATRRNWEVLMKIENWRIKSHISTPYIESTPPQYFRVKYCTDILWYSSTTYVLCAYLSIVQIFLLMHFYTALVIEEWLLWLWFGTMLFYNFCGKLVEMAFQHFISPYLLYLSFGII